jgi:hypothetical protein
MTLFGYPVTQENDAERAVRAQALAVVVTGRVQRQITGFLKPPRARCKPMTVDSLCESEPYAGARAPRSRSADGFELFH